MIDTPPDVRQATPDDAVALAQTLGRAFDCGIVVPSSIVSRYHAELLRTSNATYEISDLSACLNPRGFNLRIFERDRTVSEIVYISATDN